MSSGVYALENQRLVRVGPTAGTPERAVKKTPAPLKEPAPFFRSLAFMVKSGYPMATAFSLLGRGMERESEAQVCFALEKAVNEGKSFSEAFSATGFPNELVCALEAGELSGRLEESLEWYADFEERNEQVRRDLKEALLNPMLTLGVSLLFAMLLPPLILRDQLKMLEASGTSLPLISQLLLGFSELFFQPATLLLIPLAYKAFTTLSAYVSTVSGRRRFERLLHRLPVIGAAVKRAAASRCLALMAMILRSGGSPMAAMLIGGKGSGSRLLKDRLHSLVGGVPFTESLAKTNWFLRSSLSLLQSGEYCGDVSDMMTIASRIEEEKLRDALANVAAVIQPIALLLIGVLVCLMVIAVLGPSMSLISG